MDLQPSTNLNSQTETFTYRERHAHRRDVLEKVLEVAGGFVTTMLGFRFVLALLGANSANGFARFVNNFTAPFAAPFFSLFDYDHATVGAVTFEGYTLIAMLVYGIATLGIARLISATRYS